jgi:hypothetical protein
MVPAVTPQLVGNTGLRELRAAIAEPERIAWWSTARDGVETETAAGFQLFLVGSGDGSDCTTEAYLSGTADIARFTKGELER